MRVVDERLDAEASGTTFGDALEAHVWRGGDLLVSHLDVVSWTLSWDADRQVQGQGTLTVADADGSLAPWSMGDALAPGGSEVQVVWVSGVTGIRVPLGWWRIRSATPREEWSLRLVGGALVSIPGGGDVTLRIDERTAAAGLQRMDAETVTKATVVAELAAVLQDVCAVVVDAGVDDAPVPPSLVYGESRLDAVDDLLAVIDAAARMTPSGDLEVVPAAGVGPVWTIAGGDEGALVRVSRALSDEDVVNGVVAEGETASGAPLVGRAYVRGGPLAWGGPYGQVPMFVRSAATSPAGITADAAAVLASQVIAGQVDLDVECLTHPGVQVNDRVVVVSPTTAGDVGVTGRVVGMVLRSVSSESGTVPAKSMALRVRVSVEDLDIIAGRVTRG